MKNSMNLCPQALSLMLLLAVSSVANATTFKLIPIPLDTGYVITGTIETDGTRGLLSATNFVKWNIVVTQTTDEVFTEKNTSAANISMVSTDGKKIFVPSSIDGSTDGGSLTFTGRASGGQIPRAALVADFTALNVAGGVAGWQTPTALNYVSLNEPNDTLYAAASAIRNDPCHFRITTAIISTTPTLMKLFGTVTTDGTIGALKPANFKSWKIVGREQDAQQYNEQNSTILNAVHVFAEGQKLQVYNDGAGVLLIGTPSSPRLPGSIVRIADFTDPGFPGGFASYDYGIFGQVGLKWPLTHLQIYTVGASKPKATPSSGEDLSEAPSQQ